MHTPAFIYALNIEHMWLVSLLLKTSSKFTPAHFFFFFLELTQIKLGHITFEARNWPAFLSKSQDF